MATLKEMMFKGELAALMRKYAVSLKLETDGSVQYYVYCGQGIEITIPHLYEELNQ